MIPYGRQHITPADIQAVVDVLNSDFLTQGPVVPQFEQAVAKLCHAQYACAVNSATSALHLACLALGLGPNDILWTVPNSFVASANCGRYCGAQIDFVDIDPITWNLSVSALRIKLAQAKKENKLPKILIPVHFAGQPTEQQAIWQLAQEFGFKIIEDASHAIGASRHNEPVGSCRWSHITIFSFHPVKIITTGEGGIAVTNDPELAQHMTRLRSHGITRDPSHMQRAPEGPWCYDQLELGFNYRMTDIQAALGVSQLKRLNTAIEQRQAIAERYNQLLKELPIQRPTILPGNYSAFHLYVIRLDPMQTPHSRNDVFKILREHGVGVNVHYTPIHLQPYYRVSGFATGNFPESERHGEQAITLPLYPQLEIEQQNRIAQILAEALD